MSPRKKKRKRFPSEKKNQQHSRGELFGPQREKTEAEGKKIHCGTSKGEKGHMGNFLGGGEGFPGGDKILGKEKLKRKEKRSVIRT